MAKIETLRAWADELCRQTGFERGEELYAGVFYAKDNVRDLVIAGTFQGQPAVLKLYDDQRLCYEPRGLAAFHQHNRSRILTAPKLLASAMLTPKKGWLIMERLPSGGEWYPRPMSPDQRQTFLKLFREYRHSFPTQSPFPPTLSERLSAGEFHAHRIGRWAQLANETEEATLLAGQPPVLEAGTFVPLYERTLSVIRRQFAGRPMIWCHGHFKHREVYILDGGQRAYLIDFAHVKTYPIGYELAFMAWADWIMTDTWRMDATAWQAGMQTWIDSLIPIAKQLEYDRPEELVRASLLERVVGSILADVVGSDRSPEEKRGYLRHLLPLLKDMTTALE